MGGGFSSTKMMNISRLPALRLEATGSVSVELGMRISVVVKSQDIRLTSAGVLRDCFKPCVKAESKCSAHG